MDTPLETAHERNKRIFDELLQIRNQEGRDLLAWAPEAANYWPQIIARLQALYRSLSEARETLIFLQMEGVTEVSFRSRTQTLTWAISQPTAGRDISDVLHLHLSEELQQIEEKILEARERLTGSLTGGTTEEWHSDSVRYLALLLESGPLLSNQAA